MKISLNWLKDYLNIDLTVDQVSEILTNIGLEVEGIEKYESIRGGLEGFVIGEVLTCEKHPNADKLSVTTVNVGNEIILPIVCGAPNVAKGQKVVVATVGTTLYSDDEEFVIKKAKLRGEPSEGMICAEDEIGVGTGHDGILVLPETVVPGTRAKEHFKLESDTVFEIGLTPNRIDAASHFGVARDLAAYLRQQQSVELKTPYVENFKIDNTNLAIDVEVQDAEACPRYSGISIFGITVEPSPEWMQNRLKAIGLTPINNVVDITNYVLHELGHPLHAFDADELAGKKIIVRRAVEKEKFITLDEQERELDSNDLMICDAEKPGCIAGVFGGLNSGISDSTKNIFLESAYFNPVFVRKTAKRHQLSTDSSFRFERGADPNNTINALKRASSLIKELAGGTISSQIVDVYPEKIENNRIKVYYKNIDRLIGKQIDHDRILSILVSLDFEILDQTDEGMMLSVPTYRVDVTREADVVEEILRIYGYNNIELPKKINASLSYTPEPDNESLVNLCSDYLASRGYNEAMSNSLTKKDYYQNLESFPENKVVELLNPLSTDLNGMRQTLLFSGLETVAYNLNRQQNDLKFFEYGNCYQLKNDADKTKADAYLQSTHFGIFLTGQKESTNWSSGDAKASVYQLRSVLEGLLGRLGFKAADMQLSKLSSQNDLYSGALTYSINKKVLATAGIVKPSLLRQFDIKQEVFYGDINWGKVIELVVNNSTRFNEIAKFPAVKRDLSMVLDEGIEFAELKKVAFNVDRKILQQVDIFDVYKGKGIPEGKKSYALSFVLQDSAKTLTDKQIDKVMNNMMNAFKRDFDAEIRQ
jgi:phenylalanyl-tRNA synthetase beta chain